MAKLECKIIDGKVHTFYKVVVHTFLLGDVDDPEIYAAGPIWDWQQTDAGKYIMENATEVPSFHHQIDYQSYGHRYAITAVLEEKKLSEYYLKFGHPNHRIIN